MPNFLVIHSSEILLVPVVIEGSSFEGVWSAWEVGKDEGLHFGEIRAKDRHCFCHHGNYVDTLPVTLH